MINRFQGARIFKKLELKNADHLIRIKEGDQYKTSVRTSWEQLEYWVMPLGLMDTPASFQACIENCLWPYINNFTVCYFDHMQINSTNEEEHKELVWNVLELSGQSGHQSTAKIGRFGVSEVCFVRYMISPEAIAMESWYMSTIEDWVTPEYIWEVQVLLGFTNCHLWSIRKYA